MLSVENNNDVERKNPSDSESSAKSSEMRAFFDLVDREAHRQQLLNEKLRNSEKLPTNNSTVWQPSFELEDFVLPLNSKGSNIVNSSTITTNVQGGCDEEKEEKRLKRGLKRPRHLDNMAPLFLSDEMLKKGKSSASKVVVFDLNKEAELSEGAHNSVGH